MSFVARAGNSAEWADDLPEGWTADWVKWSVAFASAKPTDEDTEKLPYISNEDIASWTGKLLKEAPEPADKDGRLFRRDDVLFNKLRPYLAKIYHADFDGISSGELLNLRASERVLPRFLFHVLSSSAFIDTINAETFGTKMPRADWGTVGHQPLPLPDLGTQRRIAEYLDDKTARIDALIEKKRALLDRLAEKRQALITRAVTRGLNPAAPLKDSGIDWLGKVPAHWQVKKLRRVRKYLTSGSRDWAAYYADEGEPFIRMTNVTKRGVELDLSDLRFVNLDGETEGTRTAIQAGDILITITAELGSVAIARDNVEGAYINQHLALFRVNSQLCEPDFLVNFLSTDVARAQFFINGQGGTKQGLGFEQVNNVWVAFPPLSEQRELGTCCAQIWLKFEEVQRPLETSLRKLTEYRAALVTAAVTGKIKALLTDEALKPAKKEAPAAFKRSVLAAYITDTLCDHPTFGRVKLQKLLHLCEAHLEIQEVAGHYRRDAAGPFDAQMMQSVHSQIQRQGWIVTEKREGGKGTLYRRGANADAYKEYFERYFGDRKDAVDDLLVLLKAADTQQAEIVSTAFAAWNDLLLEGKTPTDDDIVDLILNDWTESKRKITSERWRSALHWMREKDLVPRGLGEHTKRKG